MEGLLNNLTIKAAGIEEESEEGLETSLEMEVDGDGEGEGDGEEGGEGAIRSLGALYFLT